MSLSSQNTILKLRKGTVLHLTLLQLLMPGTHIGYDISHWDNRSKCFLLGVHYRTYIHNLNYTYSFLRRALSLLFNILVRKGQCGLVSETHAFSGYLKRKFNFHWKNKQLSRISVVWRHLIRGTLTNRMLRRARRAVFSFFPHMLVFFSPSESLSVIHECQRVSIPSASLSDTTFFPVEATYKFPGNEKSKSVSLFLTTVVFLFALKAYLVRTKSFTKSIWNRYGRKCALSKRFTWMHKTRKTSLRAFSCSHFNKKKKEFWRKRSLLQMSRQERQEGVTPLKKKKVGPVRGGGPVTKIKTPDSDSKKMPDWVAEFEALLRQYK